MLLLQFVLRQKRCKRPLMGMVADVSTLHLGFQMVGQAHCAAQRGESCAACETFLPDGAGRDSRERSENLRTL